MRESVCSGAVVLFLFIAYVYRDYQFSYQRLSSWKKKADTDLNAVNVALIGC